MRLIAEYKDLDHNTIKFEQSESTEFYIVLVNGEKKIRTKNWGKACKSFNKYLSKITKNW